ncbi:kallikrein-4-like [Ctenodactylus gundi]
MPPDLFRSTYDPEDQVELIILHRETDKPLARTSGPGRQRCSWEMKSTVQVSWCILNGSCQQLTVIRENATIVALTCPVIYSFDTIGLGLHSLNRSQEPGSQMIKPQLSVPYPYYRFSAEHVNDIMLIKLSEPAVISDTVKPIRMASSCPKPNTECLLSGWGGVSRETPSKFLQCLDITVLSTEMCKKIHPTTRFHKMFCTYTGTYKGSTYGDSGGPVVCNGELQGIIIWGLSSTDIHINVFGFKKWIERIMKTF